MTGSIKHPSPRRQSVHWSELVVALFFAPGAWFAQILSSEILSSHACYPKDQPTLSPTWNGLEPALIAISIFSFVIGCAACWVAWRAWKKSSGEAKGAHSKAIATGEGRTRFLSLVGAWSSGLFLIAICFTGSTLGIISPCGH